MRFGMVTTFYPPFSYGGDATYVRNLAKALVEQGHDVDVIASTEAYLVRSKDGDQVVPSWEDGVSVRRIRHAAGLLAPLVSQQTGLPAFHTTALNAFFGHPFDVLHFHNISLMGGPGVLRMGQARARIMSLHDHWLICPTHALWKNRSHACDKRTCFSCTIRSGLPPQLWRYTRPSRPLAGVRRSPARAEQVHGRDAPRERHRGTDRGSAALLLARTSRGRRGRTSAPDRLRRADHCAERYRDAASRVSRTCPISSCSSLGRVN